MVPQRPTSSEASLWNLTIVLRFWTKTEENTTKLKDQKNKNVIAEKRSQQTSVSTRLKKLQFQSPPRERSHSRGSVGPLRGARGSVHSNEQAGSQRKEGRDGGKDGLHDSTRRLVDTS